MLGGFFALHTQRLLHDARVVFDLNNNKEGIDLLGRHIQKREKFTQQQTFPQDLDANFRQSVSKEDPLAVMLDFRPLNFVENCEGTTA